METGFIVNGVVVPGTEWVRRDPRYFFGPGDRGARPRDPVIDLAVNHWTAGEAGARDPDGAGPLTEFDDDGARVVSVMRGRFKDGRPLHVGITFVVGACGPDDEYAPVFQTADPGVIACVHVGKSWINSRSIGTEFVSAGVPGPTDIRKRPQVTVPFLGFKTKTVLGFYPGQIRSGVRLMDLLTRDDLPGGIRIPRRVPGVSGASRRVFAHRRFTVQEARRWRGIMEHYLVPGTTKSDAAGLTLEALADAGYEVVSP